MTKEQLLEKRGWLGAIQHDYEALFRAVRFTDSCGDEHSGRVEEVDMDTRRAMIEWSDGARPSEVNLSNLFLIHPKPTVMTRALAPCVLVVATPGHGYGDWAAYIDAVPGKSHRQEFQAVADHGTKLPKDLACILFPFDPGTYRE